MKSPIKFSEYRKKVKQQKTDEKLPAPVVDISHHRKLVDKKRVDEDIMKWVDKTQPNGHELEHIKNLSKSSFADDQHKSLAEEHVKNLTGDHHVAVSAYISGGLRDGHETGSRHVNEHLISAHNSGIEPKKHFKFGNEDEGTEELHVDHLDDAIKQNKLHKSLTTYSGISFHPHTHVDSRNTLHMPAYTSSSTSRAVAMQYASNKDNHVHHILKISHPKGSTGLYVGDNTDMSPFYQKEHLSPRNMKIKVNPEPEIHTDDHGNELHVWSAKRITP